MAITGIFLSGTAAVDAASRTKAIAKEQAAKAVRDAKRLAECKANNVELKKQGKPEVVCKAT